MTISASLQKSSTTDIYASLPKVLKRQLDLFYKTPTSVLAIPSYDKSGVYLWEEIQAHNEELAVKRRMFEERNQRHLVKLQEQIEKKLGVI